MKKLDIVLLTSLATFFFFVVLIYSNVQGCEKAVDSSKQVTIVTSDAQSLKTQPHLILNL